MDTALPQKFPFILDRNLAKAKCTGNRVCTFCDTVLLGCGTNIPTTDRWRTVCVTIASECIQMPQNKILCPVQ